jgi:hypothetical protein
LLLRLVLRSPCWLLRLLLPLDALPRSLWLLLLRLLVPRLAPDALPRPLLLEEDDFELPGFMVNAPWCLRQAPLAGRKSTLGRALRVSVGSLWPSM